MQPTHHPFITLLQHDVHVHSPFQDLPPPSLGLYYKFVKKAKLVNATQTPFFIDSEIWPNMILNLKERKIPITLINARICIEKKGRILIVHDNTDVYSLEESVTSQLELGKTTILLLF